VTESGRVMTSSDGQATSHHTCTCTIYSSYTCTCTCTCTCTLETCTLETCTCTLEHAHAHTCTRAATRSPLNADGIVHEVGPAVEVARVLRGIAEQLRKLLLRAVLRACVWRGVCVGGGLGARVLWFACEAMEGSGPPVASPHATNPPTSQTPNQPNPQPANPPTNQPPNQPTWISGRLLSSRLLLAQNSTVKSFSGMPFTALFTATLFLKVSSPVRRLLPLA
jgi:hypothetical protein